MSPNSIYRCVIHELRLCCCLAHVAFVVAVSVANISDHVSAAALCTNKVIYHSTEYKNVLVKAGSQSPVFAASSMSSISAWTSYIDLLHAHTTHALHVHLPMLCRST